MSKGHGKLIFAIAFVAGALVAMAALIVLVAILVPPKAEGLFDAMSTLKPR
jgi:hypothetical protein